MRAIRVLAVLLAAALESHGQNPVTFEWQGEIQPGQTLEIRNINGGIRAEPAAGAQAEISVRITGTNPPPESIRVFISPHAGGVLACTIYQGLSVPDYCAPDFTPSLSLHNSDIRVYYTVRVPVGVALAAKTVNGRIAAHLPGSPIAAETVNGRIDISTAKAAEARLVNGSILASLGGIDWEGARSFRSVNGTVDLELPESANATVLARTVFGHITTDFPIKVWHGFIGSRLHGDINGGGPKLVLETVNGSIHLRKADPE